MIKNKINAFVLNIMLVTIATWVASYNEHINEKITNFDKESEKIHAVSESLLNATENILTKVIAFGIIIISSWVVAFNQYMAGDINAAVLIVLLSIIIAVLVYDNIRDNIIISIHYMLIILKGHSIYTASGRDMDTSKEFKILADTLEQIGVKIIDNGE